MMLEYLGWQEAADLITAAFPAVLAKKICTYDFARQMPGAREVSTSGFADALIAEMKEIGSAAGLMEVSLAAAAKERQERESRRKANPQEEMEASGRRPHTVGDIMKRVCSVPVGTSVEAAMHRMHSLGIGSILVEPGADGLWAIMTEHDVVTKIVSANRASATVKIEEIANKPLLTAPMDMSLPECATLLQQHHVRRCVVERDGTPLGIVSHKDLFATVEAFGWEQE
jgi:isocitrate dehydrogenase